MLVGRRKEKKNIKMLPRGVGAVCKSSSPHSQLSIVAENFMWNYVVEKWRGKVRGAAFISLKPWLLVADSWAMEFLYLATILVPF